jgi:hypothetical protein
LKITWTIGLKMPKKIPTLCSKAGKNPTTFALTMKTSSGKIRLSLLWKTTVLREGCSPYFTLPKPLDTPEFQKLFPSFNPTTGGHT